jgi:tRNA(Ile2) C34 agmatinyltransferase TiaS
MITHDEAKEKALFLHGKYDEAYKTLKGYIAHFTDEVGINRAHKMNAYRMDDVITEIKRIYGNVYFYSIKHGVPHGKSN